MLAAFPILCCLLLANPRSLLADYCFLLAGRCWFLASYWSLLATRCSLLHIRGSRPKKTKSANSVTQDSQKMEEKQKVDPMTATPEKNKTKTCPFKKISRSLYEKKSRPFVGKFQKKQRKWFVRKKVGLGRLPRMCTHCTSSCTLVVVRWS